MLLDQIELISSLLKKTFSNLKIGNTVTKFRQHPGLAASYDCNSWTISEYKGEIESWSCLPILSW